MFGNPRPLVMRCGAMGDMVLLQPFIRALSARFGQPVDVISSGSWTVPLLRGQHGVGDLYMVRSRRRPYLVSPDQWRLVAALRKRRVGPTWFLDPDNIGLSLLTRAGIGSEWIVNAGDVAQVPGEHYLERWRTLASRDPAALSDSKRPKDMPAFTGCELEVPPGARAELDVLLASRGLAARPLLLVQAGNKRTMRRGARARSSNNKYWPEANWREVIRALHARWPRHAILLLGVAAERELNQDILAGLGANEALYAFNLAGELPIDRLLALLERADAMVTVDTGPAHAAAALDLPQIVLFGAADPQLYRPWGAGNAPVVCLKNQGSEPLRQLPVARVLAGLAKLTLRTEAAPASTPVAASMYR